MTTRSAILFGRLPIYVTQITCVVFALSPFIVLALCHALSFRAEELGCRWPTYCEPDDPTYNGLNDVAFNRLYNAMTAKALPLAGWSMLFVPSYFWVLRGLCSRKFRWLVVGVHSMAWMALVFDPSQNFVFWYLD